MLFPSFRSWRIRILITVPSVLPWWRKHCSVWLIHSDLGLFRFGRKFWTWTWTWLYISNNSSVLLLGRCMPICNSCIVIVQMNATACKLITRSAWHVELEIFSFRWHLILPLHWWEVQYDNTFMTYIFWNCIIFTTLWWEYHTLSSRLFNLNQSYLLFLVTIWCMRFIFML